MADGTIWHHEHAIRGNHSSGAGMARSATEYTRMAGVDKHIGMAGATGYVEATGCTMPIGTTGVTIYTA